MTTSGTADFNLNVRNLIRFALTELHVYAPEETPSAADMETSRITMNLMLKGLQRTAPSLFRRTVTSFPLVANTTSYVLEPRPYRVISARYRNAGGRDLPMELWTDEEYEEMPVKTSTGTPTAYYVDYQRDSVVMHIWQPLASVSAESIRYTYQRRLEDVATLDEDIDVPQENLDVIGYCLADRLAGSFGKAGSQIHTNVLSKAQGLLQDARSDERESVVRFVPGGR